MKCTGSDLKIMGSNLGHVELRVHSTSVEVVLEPKMFRDQQILTLKVLNF